jgi:cobalamin biosynthetic protein CobC
MGKIACMTQDHNKADTRDHGGGIDAAIAQYGGTRNDWIDLSTGINPMPYPLPSFQNYHWSQLPDSTAFDAFEAAAREFWQVPENATIIPASGASAIIAMLPSVLMGGTVVIPEPTYNEHEAAYLANGWAVADNGDVKTIVHPNNPDGYLYSAADLTAQTCVIDESFCDGCPEHSMMSHAIDNGHLIIKSFGKFWGLAGMRLGTVIVPKSLAPALRDRIGPWAVSGPALYTGTRALHDAQWSIDTRQRLSEDAQKLDDIMWNKGAKSIGGTTLFRLYHVDHAGEWYDRFAQNRILTRVFPYSQHFLRLGIPAHDQWQRVVGV